MTSVEVELIINRLDSLAESIKTVDDKVGSVDLKVNKVHVSHLKLDKNFSLFKLKAYMLVTILVGAKDAIYRKFIG